MLLRTRVILIVSLAFLALVGAVGWGVSQRDSLAEARFGEALTAGHRAVWEGLVETQAQGMERAGRELLTEGHIVAAVALGEVTTVGDAVRPIFTRLSREGVATRLDLIAADGQPMFTSLRGIVQQGPVLDAGTMDRVLREGRSVHGIAQDAARLYVGASAFPLVVDERVVGAVTLAIGLDKAIGLFKARTGSEAVLLDLRGKVVTGTAPKLWTALEPKPPLDEQRFATVRIEDRFYTLTSLPVVDTTRRRLARLITFTDTTSTVGRQQQLGQAFLFGGAVVLTVILVGLFLYLRRSFRPLESAITVLDALSRGDASVAVDARRGRDEIGRIAEAVSALREQVIALQKMERSRVQQRRRQARFIRQQMLEVAGKLEEEAREAVLGDLKRIEERSRAPAGGGEEAPSGALGLEGGKDGGTDQLVDQFGLLAVAFQNMMARVSEQYVRLDALVEELRQALKTVGEFTALQQELEIARRMQLSILPKAFPPREELEVYGQMTPAKEVGGDFYDFFPLPGDRVGVVVADVSGKGVPAAFFMAISRTLLKATASFAPSPGVCLSRLNDLLAAENDQMMFVTLFYGVLDVQTRNFRYANAGHNPPMLISADGTVSELAATGGMALAVMDDIAYAEKTIELAPGDSLFFYTDGVTEAFDIDGVQFGEERLVEVLRAVRETPARDLPRSVVGRVKSFERGAPQADDITCVVLKVASGDQQR